MIILNFPGFFYFVKEIYWIFIFLLNLLQIFIFHENLGKIGEIKRYHPQGITFEFTFLTPQFTPQFPFIPYETTTIFPKLQQIPQQNATNSSNSPQIAVKFPVIPPKCPSLRSFRGYSPQIVRYAHLFAPISPPFAPLILFSPRKLRSLRSLRFLVSPQSP